MSIGKIHSGQSLLEAVIAIGVILVATVSATTLIVTTLTVSQSSEDKIAAANLAREGIEVVRAIRDGNWLKGSQNISNPTTGATFGWMDNPFYTCSNPATFGCYNTVTVDTAYKLLGSSVNGGNKYITIFNGSQWALWPTVVNSANESTLISKSGTNYLTQKCSSGCNGTKFSRLITINSDTTSDTPTGFTSQLPFLLVTSTITWDNHGTKTYTISERLYDWR